MGAGRQRERSGKRSFGRIRSFLAQSQYNAAEVALGGVALVLVVWLLWPEGAGPQLDQRAAWQQSIEEAERRRTEETRREGDQPVVVPADAPDADVADEYAMAPERRRLLAPSELADRWDGDLRDQARLSPRARPPSLEAANTDREKPAEQIKAALEKAVGQLEPLPPLTRETDLEVAVLSTEALDAEPIPEVDLSDLDSLIPPEPKRAVPPEEFDLPSEPEADVRHRPRDDAPTWLKNAVTASLADERPVIAIVIDDLGLNRRNTAALNDLPAPLTLAFLPYAGNIAAQAEAAHDAGHELLVHLPMEPVGTAWPGPDALLTSLGQAEFSKRLEKNLNRFERFVGVNNHMGSRLTADAVRMEVVMRELRKRDVLFLDSKTSSRSIASDVAGRNGVPNTIRDVFLDHVINLDAIRKQLALVERIARRSGSAVAIGHPHADTIKALESWLPGLEDRGFALAPISAVVARRSCREGLLIAAETCGRYLQARKPDETTTAGGG